MSDEFLVIARLCLLALIYLTFLCVATALWAGLRAEQTTGQPTVAPVPPKATSPAQASSGLPRLGGPLRVSASYSELAAAAGPALVQIEGDQPGRSVVLAPVTTIGRDSRCQVRIDDPLVSKLHARVCRHGSGWVVEDLGSTNGTLLNGAALEGPAPLGAGDRLQVGYSVLEAVADMSAGAS